MFILQLPATCIAARELPRPFRELLDHGESMTFRLERHHGQRMRIEVLEERHSPAEGLYEREIVMIGCDDTRAKQIAHIRIDMTGVAEIRERILEGTEPFGRLVTEAGIPTDRRDIRHLRFPAHPALAGHLGNARPEFFGRRYALVRSPDRFIAEVVEIVA